MVQRGSGPGGKKGTRTVLMFPGPSLVAKSIFEIHLLGGLLLPRLGPKGLAARD
jgi:hypothetical protein